jgi:Rrf2 family protein
MDIAIHSGGSYLSLRNISTRHNVSLKYLEQVVTCLTRINLLDSHRGASGGYKLNRPLEDYKVSEVFKITEGTLESVLTDDWLNPSQILKDKWLGIDTVLDEYFSNITLADLVKAKLGETS